MATEPHPPLVSRSSVDVDDVDPRLLRCFVTLAEELHFGRAADRLYVAQPALSRSVQRLERLVGRPLFRRTTRAVALTPSARALLPLAYDVLGALEAVERDLARADRTLRVAHVPCSDTMAIILDRLARARPDLEVAEQTMSPAEQLRALREDRLDVALAHVEGGLEPELRAQLVRHDPVLVATLGRGAGNDRPVDVRARTLAIADGADDADLTAFLARLQADVGFRAPTVKVAAGSGTDAFAVRRAGFSAFLTVASRRLCFDGRWSIVGTVPAQAFYSWSLVVGAARRTPPVLAFLAAATDTAAVRRWTDVSWLPGEPWTGAGAAEHVAA